MFSHGFPELAYSWRHQLPALAAAGFRAIALDQRGYGASDRPEAVEAYDIAQLTGDLVGLLDALGLERAVFCGHDWGGMVIWSMGQLHPERVLGLIGVNTPFMPRPPMPPVEMLRAAMGPDHYIVHFQTPGDADQRLAKDVRRVFEMLMRRGIKPSDIDASGGIMNLATAVEQGRKLGQPLLSDAELDVFMRAFERTGFSGGIHWYRNLDRNWRLTADAPQVLDGAVAHGDVRARLRAAARARRRDGGARAESREGADPRLRALDAAGASRRAQSNPDRLAARRPSSAARRSAAAGTSASAARVADSMNCLVSAGSAHSHRSTWPWIVITSVRASARASSGPRCESARIGPWRTSSNERARSSSDRGVAHAQADELVHAREQVAVLGREDRGDRRLGARARRRRVVPPAAAGGTARTPAMPLRATSDRASRSGTRPPACSSQLQWPPSRAKRRPAPRAR